MSPKAEMQAEMDRRLAASEPTGVLTTRPAESAVDVKPEGVSAGTGSAAKDPAATPGSPKPASEAEAAPDLSFVAKEYRQFVASAPPEFRTWLREEYGDPSRLRTADYTAKTTAVANERKALEARKEAADLGAVIMADEKLLDLYRAEAKRRESPAASTTTPFDWDLATPEDREAHIQAIADARTDAKLRESEARRQSTTKAHTEVEAQRVEITAQAVKAFVDMGHKKEEFIDKVDPIFQRLGGWDGLSAIAKARGVEFSSDFVVETLREFIPKNGVKPQDSPHANGKPTVNGSNGASALTRGVGTAPALNLPSFLREGRQLTNESPRGDRIQEALYEANRVRETKGLPPLTI